MEEKALIDLIQQGINNELVSNEILDKMLENIGSLSPQLRDETIYLGFCNIFGKDILTEAQKFYMLNYVLDGKLLFSHIEEVTSDYVFTRSFTSLLLVQMIENHFRNPWIPAEKEKLIVNDAILYYSLEKDNRGFVEGYGWAHAFAHGADLLGSISKSIYYTKNNGKKTLEAVERALIDIENFLYGEEGRLARAVTEILVNSKIELHELEKWILHTSELLDDSGVYNICWINFLKSLHFNLIFESVSNIEVSKTIEKSLLLFYKKYNCL